MHIPPYYKKESWQRFFAGVFIGAIISFTVFVYMHGVFYERWVEENLDLRAQLNELQLNYDDLVESNKELNQKSKEHITIDKIEININNEEKLKLDSLIVLELEEMIKGQIQGVIGKDINSLSENYQLLTAAIENKTYVKDKFNYSATVKNLFITPPTLIVNIELKTTS